MAGIAGLVRAFAVMSTLVTAQGASLLLAAQTISAADVQRQEEAVARKLLTHEQLSPADVSRVLSASHWAMHNRTFNVRFLKAAGSNEGGTLEFQMGRHGRPRFQRAKHDYWQEELFYDYTGQRPYSCSGIPLTGELFILYEMHRPSLNPVDRAVLPDDGFVSDGSGGQIKVVADVRDSQSPFEDVFELYTDERRLSVGPRAEIDGHIARALVTHHEQRPVDRTSNSVPYPPELQDWIWIDVDSLFLVRWDIRRAGVSTDYGIVLIEEPNTELRPPTLRRGLVVPTCVEWTRQ
jgi:hypothetical protein